MIFRLLIIAAILLIPNALLAQRNTEVSKAVSATVLQELEAVIVDAERVENKNARVNIKSRAAALVSFYDPARSEEMFLQIWQFAKEQTTKEFDKEQAKIQILKYLFTRHPGLARRILAEQENSEDSPSQSTAPGLNGDSQLKVKVASELIDSSPSDAAALLEKSLSVAATSSGAGALSRLREKDSLLSDYVAAKALEALMTQPTLLSLPGLHWLGAYTFPSFNQLASTEAKSSLESLKLKYFLTAYSVLMASLKETNETLVKEQHYSQRDLQFRAAFQARVAAILAALAPQFRSSSAAELAILASKLSPQMPANLAQLSQYNAKKISGGSLESEDPEQRFIFALSKGEFDLARQELDHIQDSDKRAKYEQLLIKNEARSFLTGEDVMAAIIAIRKLEDRNARLVMYLDAIKAGMKKRDIDVTTIAINDARLLIPQTDRNGLQLRALLAFVPALIASPDADDAWEFLDNAVVTINSLSKRGKPEPAKSLSEAAMAELNDPNSLLDAAEMDKAFSSAGLVDLDRSLALAKQIETRPVQLVARLDVVERTIKRLPPEKKGVLSPVGIPQQKSKKPR